MCKENGCVENSYGKKIKAEPEITVNCGHLYLSDKAATLLAPQLAALGELLEVDNQGRKAFMFNPLKIVEPDAKLSTKHPITDGVTNLVFNEEHFVFRTAFDGYLGVFVDQQFKDLMDGAGLTGLVFESDLSHIFSRDGETMDAPSH